jgi:GNAT superfamily N-acetyltransferase
MIEIREALSKKELKVFVKFPFTIYKNSKYWVPPIIKQELSTFNKKENPVFKDADARFFLAYKNGKIAGRIVAIINWIEVNQQQVKKMRFGWFDFIDDMDVSKALLDTVMKIGKDKGLEFAEGPVGFSNLDKVGVMTEGFNHLGRMITWYNHPYYAKHYEAYGFKGEKYYLENKFPFKNVKPEFFERIQALVKKRYGLKALDFSKTEEVMEYADEMFDLFNASYASLSSFVAISDLQKAYFKKKFISFINPEYIKFVLDKDNKLVAFAIVMPSFGKALQKANGKLFPLGFKHLLHAKKHSKDVTFYLIGVHPSYQNKGVTGIIFDQYYHTFKEKGIQTCYRTPELSDNHAIHALWKDFNPEIYIRRNTFRKEL